jgi:hypothetical protein
MREFFDKTKKKHFRSIESIFNINYVLEVLFHLKKKLD